MESKIKTDKAYEDSFAWLLDRVEKMSNPLLDSDEYDEHLNKFIAVSHEMAIYKVKDPYAHHEFLKKLYAELGLREPEMLMVEDPSDDPEPEPEPPKPSANPASWLDD